VVCIAKRQKTFNDEMGIYLERRKAVSEESSSFFKKVDSLIPKRKKNIESVPDVDDINPTVIDGPKKKSWFWALFSYRSTFPDEEELDDFSKDVKEVAHEIEEEIEEVDNEVDELEGRREGLFSRLFALLRGRPREDEYGDDIPPEVVAGAIGEHQKNEDLIKETRLVLKSLHRWLGKLPPEQIESFKRSPDFVRYKELLDKYGLIK
jgi:hypothetical protein